MKNDSLGDRMKMYESQYTNDKLLPLVPWIARLDGKAFHTFTKGLERPFCKPLRDMMVEVTKILVHSTQAKIGYTQSDEISLVWYSSDYRSEGPFKGKVYKLNSVLSSMCTVAFNKLIPNYLGEGFEKKVAFFDCRVFSVPSKEEAINTLLWRQLDAKRNFIQMAGQANFSHKELDRKDQNQIKDMLLTKNIDWNNYPDWAKYGTFIQRKKQFVPFTQTEIDKLPVNHEARKNPNLLVKRSMLIQSSKELKFDTEWVFGE